MTSDKYIIGMGGGTGSGKTTIAKALKKEINGNDDYLLTISLDNYYIDLSDIYNAEERKELKTGKVLENDIELESGKVIEEGTELNYDHPEIFDWQLVKEHLEKLKDDKDIEMPIYDFKEHKRSEKTNKISPRDLLVVEGIFALYDEELRNMYDMKIYVDTDDDIRILRRIMRDVRNRGRKLESVKDQYISTVKKMHETYVEPTSKEADVIIPRGLDDLDNSDSLDSFEDIENKETLEDVGLDTIATKLESVIKD